jgi:hypothetical protein
MERTAPRSSTRWLLGGTLTGDIEIAWQVRGVGDRPTNAQDFMQTSGTVTLRKNDEDGKVTIRVTPITDQVDEPDEEFELTIRVLSGTP